MPKATIVGPVSIQSCIYCIHRTLWNDWWDGDYFYCHHPKAAELAPKHYPHKAIGAETPSWCPVLQEKVDASC